MQRLQDLLGQRSTNRCIWEALMYYWTPKRIKELKAAGYKLHASPASLVKKSDQAISLKSSDENNLERSPGPGQKLQASSTKPQAPSSLSNKLQASSPVAKASSFKPQASSAKIPEPGNK